MNTSFCRFFSPNTLSLLLLMNMFSGMTSSVAAGDLSPIEVVFRDLHYIVDRPRSFSNRNVLGMASFASLVSGLSVNKRGVNRGIKTFLKDNEDRKGGSFRGFKFLGDSGVVPGIGAFFLVGGLEAGSSRETETGAMILESYAFTGFFTLIGQFILAEERPWNGGELKFFRGGGHGVSGHSALAASVVCPLTHQYLQRDPDDGKSVAVAKEILRITVWGLPLMTGISRIENSEHYSWNVILGLAVGYSIGHVVATSHEEARKGEKGGASTHLKRSLTARGKLTWSLSNVSYSF